MSVVDGLLLLWLFRLLYLVCAAMAVAIVAANCPWITLVVGIMLADTLTLMAVIVILSISVVAAAVILLVALMLLIAILLVII